MPSYTVPLQGGGAMTVNASDPQAAQDNVRAQGGTPAGAGSVDTSRSGGGTDYSSGTSSSTSPSGTQTGANLAAGTLLLQQAQNAANQAYLNAKLALDTDTEAYQKAAQAAATEIAQAGVTGTYQGMPTQAAIKQAADIASQQAATMLSQAQQFGTWGTPQQGQQTLGAQQQAYTQAATTAGLTGWYTPPSYSPVPPITGPASGGGAGAPTAPTAPKGAFAGQYAPGTVVRTSDNQFGVVNADGTLTTGYAAWPQVYPAIQRGSGIMTVPDATFAQAAAAAQQYATAQQQYATAQQQYAAQQAAAPPTGTPASTGQPGQAPVQTLAGNQQAFQQQIDAQKQALAQWQAQQTAAQNYLTMMAGLRGPADYAQYQKVLGSTPGGMKDLAAAAAGQYIPGGGATTGVQPTAVNLQNFVGSATGTGQPTDTSGQAAMNSLVAPNQMAPQTWNALTPSQQQMLLGTWESQGYTKEDAQALFNQSLPRYATQSPSSGQFKLS